MNYLYVMVDQRRQIVLDDVIIDCCRSHYSIVLSFQT